MKDKNIFRKVLNFGTEIITRIKIEDEKSRQEYFRRTFCIPPAENEPNTRRRGVTMVNGVMFYDEKWEPEKCQWVETSRDYWSSGAR